MKRIYSILSFALIFCICFSIIGCAEAPMIEKKAKNILLLGIDSRHGERSRADTIMLINVRDDKVNVISIPRDTQVDLGRRGLNKINASYAYGGAELCRGTVENLLQTRIDNYFVVDFKAVQKGIDALGGINIEVQKDIRISDPELKQYFKLKKGKQWLNGIQALEYLRFRRDSRADIGRIERQQGFIRNAQETYLKASTIPMIPKLFSAVKGNIATDMNIFDMISYFDLLHDCKDRFEYHTLKGQSEYQDQVCYYIHDSSSIRKIRQLLD